MDEINLFINGLVNNIHFSAAIFFLLFAIYVLNTLCGNIFFVLGIIPRKWYGLPGIIFSPFLHGGFTHLLFNSLPLVILINVLLMKGKLSFFLTTSEIMIIGGLLTWIFGRDAIHLGASGVILGYMGYFMMYWYLDQSILNTITLIVLLYYIGGILMGLMPDDDSVSWEGHVFGFIAGIMSALLGLSYLPYPLWLREILQYPGFMIYKAVLA